MTNVPKLTTEKLVKIETENGAIFVPDIGYSFPDQRMTIGMPAVGQIIQVFDVERKTKPDTTKTYGIYRWKPVNFEPMSTEEAIKKLIDTKKAGIFNQYVVTINTSYGTLVCAASNIPNEVHTYRNVWLSPLNTDCGTFNFLDDSDPDFHAKCEEAKTRIKEQFQNGTLDPDTNPLRYMLKRDMLLDPTVFENQVKLTQLIFDNVKASIDAQTYWLNRATIVTCNMDDKNFAAVAQNQDRQSIYLVPLYEGFSFKANLALDWDKCHGNTLLDLPMTVSTITRLNDVYTNGNITDFIVNAKKGTEISNIFSEVPDISMRLDKAYPFEELKKKKGFQQLPKLVRNALKAGIIHGRWFFPDHIAFVKPTIETVIDILLTYNAEEAKTIASFMEEANTTAVCIFESRQDAYIRNLPERRITSVATEVLTKADFSDVSDLLNTALEMECVRSYRAYGQDYIKFNTWMYSVNQLITQFTAMELAEIAQSIAKVNEAAFEQFSNMVRRQKLALDALHWEMRT